MLELLGKILLALRSVLEVSASREAEILVLRQQLLVLSRKSPKRARLRNIDRLILVWLCRLFPSLLEAVVIVKPETGLRWHRRGFRAYWRWKSWRSGGRPRIDRELRELIRRMSVANPLWGAPRIHGELLMLGFEVSQATVSRYLSTVYRRPGQSWRTFIRNQAMAFRLSQSLEQDSDSEFPDFWNASSDGGEVGRAGLNPASSYAEHTRSSLSVRRLQITPRGSRNACDHHFPIQLLTRSPPYHARASPRLPRPGCRVLARIKF